MQVSAAKRIQPMIGFVALLSVIGACSIPGQKTAQKPTPPLSSDYVASLKENLPEFERMAHEWQADSCLESASVSIGYKAQKPPVVSVSYTSPSANLTLSIIKKGDEIVLTNYFPAGNISPTDLINNSDWVLDSQEVFDLAYNYLNPEYVMDESGHLCGVMVLRRDLSITGKPVIWRVYFDNCTSLTGEPSANIIIDPISGVEIRRSTPGDIPGFITPSP